MVTKQIWNIKHLSFKSVLLCQSHKMPEVSWSGFLCQVPNLGEFQKITHPLCHASQNHPANMYRIIWDTARFKKKFSSKASFVYHGEGAPENMSSGPRRARGLHQRIPRRCGVLASGLFRFWDYRVLRNCDVRIKQEETFTEHVHAGSERRFGLLT